MNDIPALVRFRAFAHLEEAEFAALLPLVSEPKSYKMNAVLQREGDRSSAVYLLLQGWTASSMTVPDGQRQLLKVHMPGDLIGLPGLPVTAVPDTVYALTDIVACRIKLDELGRLFAGQPRLAALLFLISQEERLMLMDRLASIGRLSVAGRLAVMILQLHARMTRHDPEIRDTLRWPLTQADFADLIGATTVHTNRTIMQLRQDGILRWDRNEAEILDRAALRRIAGLPERKTAPNQSWLPPSI